MNRKNFIVIIFMMIVCCVKAQHWQGLSSTLDATVQALLTDSGNNLLYVGGNFQNAGGISAKGIAKWNGSTWDSLGCNNFGITSILEFNNKIYSNGICSLGLAQWTGSTWQSLSGTFLPASGLFATTSYLYIGGNFDSIDGIPASKIAKWDGINWSAIDTTTWNGLYSKCAINYQGDLYVAGDISNTIADVVARWNGTQWFPLGNNSMGSHSGRVNCFAEYKNELYIGGMFTTSNGNPGNGIVKWDGAQYLDVGGGVGPFPGQVWAMKVFNGDLYVAGSFIFVGNGMTTFCRIAKWDGTNWCTVSDTINAPITSLEVYNNELYIGGGFTQINNDTIRFIAKWVGGNFGDSCSSVSINELTATANSISLYPNPVKDNIIINYSLRNKNASLQLFNMLGKLVATYQIEKGSTEKTIALSNLASGVYAVRMVSDEGSVSRKFVKE